MISSSNKIIETPTKKRLRHRCFHVNVVHNTSGRPILCNLTHSFPMHPFSTRVLIIPERLRLTLFSQSALISQLHQHFSEKLKSYTLGNRNSRQKCFTVVISCQKLFRNIISYLLHIRYWMQLSSHHFFVC